jgi:hypothetical protein
MHNPYTARTIIKDPAAFFGRKEVIQQLFENLATFQNTSIVGERRSGKSSLLWQISRPEIYKYCDTGGERPLLILFFDFQSVSALNEKAFFKLLSVKLLSADLEAAANIRAEPPIPQFDSPQMYFDALLHRIAQTHRLVLCLDEFETITSNEHFDKAFLFSLRAFANQGLIAYITSSRAPLHAICANSSHLQGSDFWNIFLTPPTYIGMLKRPESLQLITIPAAKVGLLFQPAEVEFILDLAGDHPLFLQIACYHCLEIKRERAEPGASLELTELERQCAFDQFIMSAAPHFEKIWSHLSSGEKRILAHPEVADSDPETSRARKDLVKKGLLIASKPDRVFSSSFALFAKESYSPERGVAATVLPAESQPAAPDSFGYLNAVFNTLAGGVQRRSLFGRMDVWLGRNKEVLINFSGPFSQSFFCPSTANWSSTDLKRFDERVRKLPKSDSWRLEKQEIGRSVLELFEKVPEISQIYTHGRGAVGDDDELLTLTFRCPKEMLSFPFEFISSFSSVDEGQVHLALTHPIRKTILNIRCRRQPLNPDFFTDPNARALLVSSNVSGILSLNRKQYQVPEIPSVETEIEAIRELIEVNRQKGCLRAEVDIKHNPFLAEMSDCLKHGGYHLVHFSGHGIYADSPEDSCLLFRGPNNTIERLTANRLNALLQRSKVRFFYLSCCEGAATGMPDQLLSSDFLGITDALIIAGVPSVIAMRWPVNDRAATRLAVSLYRELMSGNGLELSLLRARREVQNQDPGDYTWLSPILVIQGD